MYITEEQLRKKFKSYGIILKIKLLEPRENMLKNNV